MLYAAMPLLIICLPRYAAAEYHPPAYATLRDSHTAAAKFFHMRAGQHATF